MHLDRTLAERVCKQLYELTYNYYCLVEDQRTHAVIYVWSVYYIGVPARTRLSFEIYARTHNVNLSVVLRLGELVNCCDPAVPAPTGYINATDDNAIRYSFHTLLTRYVPRATDYVNRLLLRKQQTTIKDGVL